MNNGDEAFEEALENELSRTLEKRRSQKKGPSVAFPAFRPILTPEIEEKLMEVTQMFLQVEKWKSWGLHHLREQGAAILLEGPPGTGKTVAARWLAKLVRKGFQSVSLADLDSDGSPGSAEKGLRNIFKDAAAHKNRTLFFDECDIIVRNRSNISGDGLTWMVSTTETFMTCLSEYHGLVILATNHPQDLDPAIFRRLLTRIVLTRPSKRERSRLWRQKLPKQYPWQPTPEQFALLATYDLTGSEIETSIINASSEAIRKGIKPTFKLMCSHAKEEEEAADYARSRNGQ